MRRAKHPTRSDQRGEGGASSSNGALGPSHFGACPGRLRRQAHPQRLGRWVGRQNQVDTRQAALQFSERAHPGGERGLRPGASVSAHWVSELSSQGVGGATPQPERSGLWTNFVVDGLQQRLPLSFKLYKMPDTFGAYGPMCEGTLVAPWMTMNVLPVDPAMDLRT